MNPEPRPRLDGPSFPFPGQTGSEDARRPPAPAEHPWDHCPNCGARLENQRCRYACPRCRYFMSCSDFD